MLSILLKLVVLYYIFKFVINHFVPYLKGNSLKKGKKDQNDKVKRFESDDKQVKEAEFDEL